jgi:Tfp pilus assembly protein PilX
MVMMIRNHTENRLINGVMPTLAKAQQGLVLFFALIALVVMSLAAVALIRSVDTGVIVAGNLAFKQSATIDGDNGLSAAMAWIQSNGTALNAPSPANGYYETSTTGIILTKATGGSWPGGLSAWSPGSSSAYVTGITGFSTTTNIGQDQITGNTVQYVIERMCRVTGAPTTSACLMGTATSNDGKSYGTLDDSHMVTLSNSSLSPMYRITAKITGPKNTISYVQSYVF